MRIGIINPNRIALPPTPKSVPKGFSGALERVSWLIGEELVRRGHEVVTFASGDSKTSSKLVAISPRATSFDDTVTSDGRVDYEYWLIEEAMRYVRNHGLDVIHTHMAARASIFSAYFPCPVVGTLHSPLRNDDYRFIAHKDSIYYVSISDSQRSGLPMLNFIGTVYNGIPIEDFSFMAKPGNHLSFVARITPEKGLDVALKVAHALRTDLDIFGEVPESHRIFYEREITPLRRKSDHFRGFRFQSLVQKEVGRSRALLVPIEWEEPFGLVVIEANATGTPAVAFARGSMPELIKDGVNGFLVKPGDVRGMIRAVKRIYDMSEAEYMKLRENSRRHVEQNFTLQKMVDGYLKVYEKAIEDYHSRRRRSRKHSF
jgi:glycosyltransferase involved in cell wall biosynthesis